MTRLIPVALLLLVACGAPEPLEAHVWDCSSEVRCAGTTTTRAYVMRIRGGSYCTVTQREAETKGQEVCGQYLTGSCGECIPGCVDSGEACLP